MTADRARLVLCNTPFQIVLAQVLLNDLDLRADLVQTVAPSDRLAYLDPERWREVQHVSSLSPRDTRGRRRSRELTRYRLAVLRRRVIGYRLPHKQYDEVYIFNDADVTNQLVLSRVVIGSMLFLDDGLSWVASELLPQRPPPRGLKRWAKRWLGLWDEGYRGRGCIDAAYVFDAALGGARTIDFAEILQRQRRYVEAIANRCVVGVERFVEPDYLILTQPFTEEGLCREMEEVEVLRAFVADVPPGSRVVVKVHPWDPNEKYRALSAVHARVEMVEASTMPYELLHARLRPKCLVSFSSAALLIAPHFYPCRLISLLKWLTTDTRRYVEILDRTLGTRVEYPERAGRALAL